MKLHRHLATAAYREGGTSDVATLLFAEECHWKSGGPVPVEGQPLGSGELHLLEGLALLRFHGGATALLSGDVRVDLESRGSMRLHHGRLNAHAPEEAIGFTVRTPVSDVVDLGTEFALDVQRSGETKLEVIEGAVEYRKPEGRPGSGTLLEGGQAVRLIDKHVERQNRSHRVPSRLNNSCVKPTHGSAKTSCLCTRGFSTIPERSPVRCQRRLGMERSLARATQVKAVGRIPARMPRCKLAFNSSISRGQSAAGEPACWNWSPAAVAFVRPLAKPLSLKRNAVYYISMMMRETAGENDDDKPTRREIARLTLRGSGSYWADRIGLGLHAGHSPHIEITDFNRFVGPRIAGSQSMIWAAKIVARKQGEDQVFLSHLSRRRLVGHRRTGRLERRESRSEKRRLARSRADI